MRRGDWKERLRVFIDSARGMPPVHCAYFVGRAVEEMTDRVIIPSWVTGHVARDTLLMRNRGFDTLDSFMGSIFLETGRAMPGDVVMLDDDDSDEPMCGILQGREVYVMSKLGMTMVSRDRVVKAYVV